jgi:hypothetical protein
MRPLTRESKWWARGAAVLAILLGLAMASARETTHGQNLVNV